MATTTTTTATIAPSGSNSLLGKKETMSKESKNQISKEEEKKPPESSTSRRSRRRSKNKNNNSSTGGANNSNHTQFDNNNNNNNNMETIAAPGGAWSSTWANEVQLLEDALSYATSSVQSREDFALRRFAVDHLEVLLSKWTPKSKAIASAAPACTTTAGPSYPLSRTRPTLVTFGSYRLGVHREDSDLDVLALCPPEFTRDDFFSSWVDLLRQDSQITKVHPIRQAYTPVVKFCFQNKIQVDMLFARVADGTKLRDFQQGCKVSPALAAPASTSTIHDGTTTKTTTTTTTIASRVEYTIDDSDLKDQDEEGVRSLNGARVSQMLLEMVPDLHKFRTVLRAVKEWAVAKGVYSNVLGFLGGVNFAILVAWICRECPADTDAPTLIRYFFRTFGNWSWPTPVMLLPISSQPPEGAPLMPAWNPQQNPRDGLHIMPIVTPAYPSMNSSYNVGMPQLRRIQEEMHRAALALAFNTGPSPTMKKGSNRTSIFTSLFEPCDFFAHHGHFLQITIRAPNEQDFLEWFRLVESRLRLLITNLETMELHVYPFGQFYECKYDGEGNALGELGRSDKDNLHESLFFIALRYARGLEQFHLAPLTSDFLYKINSWPGRKPGMDLSLAEVKQADLPDFVRPSPEKLRGYTSPKENNRGNFQYFDNLNAQHYYSDKNRQRKNQYHRNISNGNKAPNHYQQNGGQHTRKYNLNRNSNGCGGWDGINLQPSASITSSLLSEDRAGETEETQSMGSDISFGDSLCSSSSSAGGSHKSNKSPMKRICVYNGPHHNVNPTDPNL